MMEEKEITIEDIANRMVSKLVCGIQIIYVPMHADFDTTHPDCEPGFVTSVTDKGAFCRYWQKPISNPPELRTKLNSELTSFGDIVIQDTVQQANVIHALYKYCTK